MTARKLIREADTRPAKFWTISQNNSGGIFDHEPDKGIGYAICVEAHDKAQAEHRLSEIIGSYPASYDCPCCGDRWSIWLHGDGDSEPSLYGEPLTSRWGTPSYVHRLDGSIEEHSEQAA